MSSGTRSNEAPMTTTRAAPVASANSRSARAAVTSASSGPASSSTQSVLAPRSRRT
ncbi:MAG: hypothetical protein H6713_36855 [Myxococcales bacterium]|nr:hypothetical protein [Myxococcales bacterium]